MMMMMMICSRYVNVTDRQTDGQTTYASRGKNRSIILNIWRRCEQEFGVLFFDSRSSSRRCVCACARAYWIDNKSNRYAVGQMQAASDESRAT